MAMRMVQRPAGRPRRGAPPGLGSRRRARRRALRHRHTAKNYVEHTIGLGGTVEDYVECIAGLTVTAVEYAEHPVGLGGNAKKQVYHAAGAEGTVADYEDLDQ